MITWVFLQDRAWQAVERKEIGDLPLVFHHVRVNDVLLREQEMLNFVTAPVELDLGVRLKVIVEEVPHTVDVLSLHRPDTSNRGVLWKLVHPDVSR